MKMSTCVFLDNLLLHSPGQTWEFVLFLGGIRFQAYQKVHKNVVQIKQFSFSEVVSCFC